MGRRAPRPAALAIREARDHLAPPSALAAVQAAWPAAVGEQIARVAEPVSERDGTVMVRCQSATWAAELDLMQAALLERLREEAGPLAPQRLRFDARSGGTG